MLETRNFPNLPLVSFDVYLDNYRRLAKNLKREVEVKQIRSILKRNLDATMENMVKQDTFDALVVTDRNRNIVWVNHGFTEMTGYDKKYALGKKPNFLQGEQTSKTIIKEIGEKINNNQNYVGSILNYKKNGEKYLCEIQIMPLFNSKNELTHFMAFEKELAA
ncbi:PAS domain-containing protein [Flagellimonas crocea]|uniref:PAS domain-containing protein n=1 Tax=Flagellimonas crocea TaxID=3067311 RepID=UPI00296EFE9F|nr:PAS domain-containing protein [Muricauda sp. DH64]